MKPINSAPPSAAAPRKPVIRLALAVLALVVLLGGTAFGVYSMAKANNAPDSILKASLNKSFAGEGIASAGFDGKVALTGMQTAMLRDFTFSGVFDDKGTLNLVANAVVGDQKLDLEARALPGEELFMKIAGIDSLSDLLIAVGQGELVGTQRMQFEFIGRQINGQWYAVEREMLDGMGEGTPLELILESMSGTDLPKLKTLYREHPFLTAKDKLADETILGEDNHHLTVAVDKARLKAYLEAGRRSEVQSLQIEEDKYRQILASIDRADFDQRPLEVWINKDSKFISQIAASWLKEGMSGKATVTFKDINKPLSVRKPEGAKSTLELIGNLIPLLQPYINRGQAVPGPAAPPPPEVPAL